MTESTDGHEVKTVPEKHDEDDPVAAIVDQVPTRPRLKQRDTMNGPLYMQTSQSNVVLVRRLKRKDEGTWKQFARWFVENQIGIA